MTSRAVCTAVIFDGAVTQRVDRVVRPKREAVDLIARAEKIREASARKRDAEERGFVKICISTYPDDLDLLDKLVDQLRVAGVRDISRSRLIRIALRRLDVDALSAELLGVT